MCGGPPRRTVGADGGTHARRTGPDRGRAAGRPAPREPGRRRARLHGRGRDGRGRDEPARLRDRRRRVRAGRARPPRPSPGRAAATPTRAGSRPRACRSPARTCPSCRSRARSPSTARSSTARAGRAAGRTPRCPSRRTRARPCAGRRRPPTRGLPADAPVRLDHARAVGERHGRGRARERHAGGRTSASRRTTRSRSARTPPTRSPTATATRRTRSTRPRSPTARACCSREEYYAGLGLSGSYRALQAALGYDRGTRVLERRPARQPVDRAGARRRRGLRAPDAVARRRHRRRQRLDRQLGAAAARGSCTRSTSTSRPRPAGTPTRTSSPRARCPRTATTGTTNATRLGGPELLRRDERGGRARADQRRRPARLVRGPADRDHRRRRERHDRRHLPLQQRRPRHRGRRATPTANPIGEAEYALSLIGADRSLLETLQYEGDEGGSCPTTARSGSTFDEGELEDLQQLALEDLADQVAVNGGDPSAEDIAASLEDGDGVVEYDGVEYAFEPWLTGLAGAQTPRGDPRRAVLGAVDGLPADSS